LYFGRVLENEEVYFRLQITNRKLEHGLSLEGFQQAPGAFGSWSGLDQE
jgi:hypothetical protein